MSTIGVIALLVLAWGLGAIRWIQVHESRRDEILARTRHEAREEQIRNEMRISDYDRRFLAEIDVVVEAE